MQAFFMLVKLPTKVHSELRGNGNNNSLINLLLFCSFFLMGCVKHLCFLYTHACIYPNTKNKHTYISSSINIYFYICIAKIPIQFLSLLYRCDIFWNACLDNCVLQFTQLYYTIKHMQTFIQKRSNECFQEKIASR